MCSVALPFLLGGGLALLLYPANHVVHGQVIGKLAFVLFLGVAMSITAFPVLARILTGLKIHRSPLGTFVMTCAASTDVAAWAILAVVVAVAAGGDKVHTCLRLAEMVLFIAVLAFGIRPPLKAALNRLAAKGHQQPDAASLHYRRAPAIGFCDGVAGLQADFWGFHLWSPDAKGILTEGGPRDTAGGRAGQSSSRARIFRHHWAQRKPFGPQRIRLPAHSANNRRRSVGKFVGAGGSAMLCGSAPRRAAAIGVLMNSRGLTELVVIQVGVSLGILSERLSSMLIIMAIVTTVAATPLFKLLYKGSRPDAENDTQATEPSRVEKKTRTAVKG